MKRSTLKQLEMAQNNKPDEDISNENDQIIMDYAINYFTILQKLFLPIITASIDIYGKTTNEKCVSNLFELYKPIFAK